MNEQTIGGKPVRRIVAGFDEFCTRTPTKTALLAYLTKPLDLAPSEREPHLIIHSKAIQIPRALNELGYSVDVVEYNDTEFVPEKHYDLFVGHHSFNFEQISRTQPDETVRIYFASCVYWNESNRREAERFANLEKRRGFKLRADRALSDDEEYANRVSDGIICLGNQRAAQNFSHFPQVINVNNSIHPTSWPGWQTKDYDAGRDHFLFFSGPGPIHKGLDLVVEAFADSELNLHICQKTPAAFLEAYAEELARPNITYYGKIPMRGDEFGSLARRCNWVISASCAEGQSRAVLECMSHGLVPLISESTHIDLSGFGSYFRDCDVKTIKEAARRASELSAAECRRQAKMALESARKNYTPERFVHNFKSAVQKIVDTAGEQGLKPAQNSLRPTARKSGS